MEDPLTESDYKRIERLKKRMEEKIPDAERSFLEFTFKIYDLYRKHSQDPIIHQQYIDELQQELKSKNDALILRERLLNDLQTANISLASENEDLKNRLQRGESMQTTNLTQLNAELDNLRTQLATVQREYSIGAQRYEELNRLYVDLQYIENGLKNQITGLQAQLELCKQSETGTELNQLRAQIVNQESDIQALKIELKQSRESAIGAYIQTIIHQTPTSIRYTKDEYIKHLTDIVIRYFFNEHSENSTTVIVENLSRALTELDIKPMYTDLETRIKQMNDELMETNTLNGKMEIEKKELYAQFDTMQREIDKLNDELTKLQSVNSNLIQQMKTLQHDETSSLDGLLNDIQKLKVESSSETASIMNESTVTSAPSVAADSAHGSYVAPYYGDNLDLIVDQIIKTQTDRLVSAIEETRNMRQTAKKHEKAIQTLEKENRSLQVVNSILRAQIQHREVQMSSLKFWYISLINILKRLDKTWHNQSLGKRPYDDVQLTDGMITEKSTEHMDLIGNELDQAFSWLSGYINPMVLPEMEKAQDMDVFAKQKTAIKELLDVLREPPDPETDPRTIPIIRSTIIKTVEILTEHTGLEGAIYSLAQTIGIPSGLLDGKNWAKVVGKYYLKGLEEAKLKTMDMVLRAIEAKSSIEIKPNMELSELINAVEKTFQNKQAELYAQSWRDVVRWFSDIDPELPETLRASPKDTDVFQSKLKERYQYWVDRAEIVKNTLQATMIGLPLSDKTDMLKSTVNALLEFKSGREVAHQVYEMIVPQADSSLLKDMDMHASMNRLKKLIGEFHNDLKGIAKKISPWDVLNDSRSMKELCGFISGVSHGLVQSLKDLKTLKMDKIVSVSDYKYDMKYYIPYEGVYDVLAQSLPAWITHIDDINKKIDAISKWINSMFPLVNNVPIMASQSRATIVNLISESIEYHPFNEDSFFATPVDCKGILYEDIQHMEKSTRDFGLVEKERTALKNALTIYQTRLDQESTLVSGKNSNEKLILLLNRNKLLGNVLEQIEKVKHLYHTYHWDKVAALPKPVAGDTPGLSSLQQDQIDSLRLVWNLDSVVSGVHELFKTIQNQLIRSGVDELQSTNQLKDIVDAANSYMDWSHYVLEQLQDQARGVESKTLLNMLSGFQAPKMRYPSMSMVSKTVGNTYQQSIRFALTHSNLCDLTVGLYKAVCDFDADRTVRESYQIVSTQVADLRAIRVERDLISKDDVTVDNIRKKVYRLSQYCNVIDLLNNRASSLNDIWNALSKSWDGYFRGRDRPQTIKTMFFEYDDEFNRNFKQLETVRHCMGRLIQYSTPLFKNFGEMDIMYSDDIPVDKVVVAYTQKANTIFKRIGDDVKQAIQSQMLQLNSQVVESTTSQTLAAIEGLKQQISKPATDPTQPAPVPMSATSQRLSALSEQLQKLKAKKSNVVLK